MLFDPGSLKYNLIHHEDAHPTTQLQSVPALRRECCKNVVIPKTTPTFAENVVHRRANRAVFFPGKLAEVGPWGSPRYR
jgi:hypothetical protein